MIRYLVERGLGHRVVLDAEALLVGRHELEDARQGRGGDLVLQRVVVLLPLHAAREAALHEALGGAQVRGGPGARRPDLHGHHVAVPEPERGAGETELHTEMPL